MLSSFPTSAAATATQRELLYRELQPLLLRLKSRYGSDHEARQDLTGEFYSRFHTLYESYDPNRGIPLRPYLVRNLSAGIYTWARAEWRRKGRVKLSGDLNALPTAIAPDPALHFGEAERRERLLSVVAQEVQHLSPRQREVLLARYYGGRSFEEIAASLGVRPATVRSLARHGINKLRQQLKSQGFPIRE